MYPLGSLVRLTGSFVDENDRPANPDVVTLYLARPRQKVSTVVTSLVNPSLGVFTHDVLLDAAGTWRYGWVGTGRIEAASFDIPLQVAPSVLHN